MKYIVARRFRCVKTGERYQPGDVYNSDAERGKYLQGLGILGREIKSAPKDEEEEATSIEAMSYKQLQKLAKERGINAVGVKKIDLIEALK